jgi:YNFM family putative membrane transporter
MIAMLEFGSKAYWRAALSICAASYFIFAMMYVPQPMLPLFTQEFAVSETMASLIMSITVFSIGVCLLFFGPLSDALGRKSIMVWSMLGCTICTSIIALAPTVPWVITLRALQGIFLAGLPSVAMAYMSEQFTPRALGISIGIYISANTLGGMSGRIAGGALADLWGWRSAFLIVGCVSLLFWICFALMLPHSKPVQRSPFRFQAAWAPMKLHVYDPCLRRAFLVGGINASVFFGGLNYLTFRLSEAPFHLPASVLGLLFLAYIGGTVGSTASGRFSERRGKPSSILLGMALLAGGFLLTLIPSLWVMIPALVLQCFGFFFAHAATAAWVNANARFALASAASLYLCSYYLGGASGMMYLGIGWKLARWPGVIVIALLALGVSAWCALRIRSQA